MKNQPTRYDVLVLRPSHNDHEPEWAIARSFHDRLDTPRSARGLALMYMRDRIRLDPDCDFRMVRR